MILPHTVLNAPTKVQQAAKFIAARTALNSFKAAAIFSLQLRD